MKGLGILILLAVIFAAGVFAGGYLTGYSPGEMIELVKEKFQVEEPTPPTPPPTTPPAPTTPRPTILTPTPMPTPPTPSPIPIPTLPPATVEVYNTAPVGLRVRAIPLVEEGNILGKVFDGTRFLVIGGPERGSGYEWLKVRLEGWAAANWLSPAPAVGTTIAVRGTGDLGLRIRGAPLINNNIVGKVYDGTSLLVLEGPASGSGYQWWKVKLEGWAASQYLRKPTVAPISTKAELVETLKDLREVMLKKIDWDTDNTAMAFTNVKDYWRSKRWADIIRAPLRVVEDTLISLAKAIDLKSLAKEANASLDKSEAIYQVLSTVMMVQDLQQVGEKLYYGLSGPPYAKAIKDMLEAADATFIPPFGDDWQTPYRRVVRTHLYGGFEDLPGPLVIGRQSTTLERKKVEFARGALPVRRSISQKFKDLITEIESRELPEGFPIDKVVAQVKYLKTQVLKSTSYSTDVQYKTYLRDGERYIPNYVKTKLGAVGELYRVFGLTAGRVAEKLKIEERVEVLKLMETAEIGALLYTITYKIPGVEEIKVAQKATVLAELSIKSYGRTFYPGVEEKFYMLPQEMVLSLPTELSNLWMIADDTDEYLRHLCGE